MNAPLPPRRRDALHAAPAMRVLERVAAEGREALAPADVAALLESLGLAASRRSGRGRSGRPAHRATGHAGVRPRPVGRPGGNGRRDDRACVAARTRPHRRPRRIDGRRGLPRPVSRDLRLPGRGGRRAARGPPRSRRRARSMLRLAARPRRRARRACRGRLVPRHSRARPRAVGGERDAARRRGTLHAGEARGSSTAPPARQDRQAAASRDAGHRRRVVDGDELRPHHPAQPRRQRLSEGADHDPAARRSRDRRRPLRG